MADMNQLLNQLLPILILLFLGNRMRAFSFLNDATVDHLKKLVVNFTLPAILFLSFLNIKLETRYLSLAAVTFVLPILLYLAGVIIGRWTSKREHFPFLLTGFEYGMLAVSLFGSAYGAENIGYIAIADLGHEFFIWFVFVIILTSKAGGRTNVGGVLKSFATSPIILAIVLGIVLNEVGLRESLDTTPGIGAIMISLGYLAQMTIPLILIIVGFGIRIERDGLGEVLRAVAIRAAICVPLALALNVWLIRGLLGLGPMFEAALFTLLVTPPPFIIPLFMKDDPEEKRFVNNVLAVYTLFTVIMFALYVTLHPELAPR